MLRKSNRSFLIQYKILEKLKAFNGEAVEGYA